MSDLHKHIQKQQDTACTLKGVIEAIGLLDNEGIGANAVAALILVAERMIAELYDSLDSVHLPEVSA